MSRSRTLLLVEDNPDDVELALHAFKNNEFVNEIVVARDGQEALDYLFLTGAHAGRDPTVMPELVLLDLKLPKVDGLEVLRQMRADRRTRRIPVAVMTSSGQQQDIASSYDLGANSFLRKPVEFRRFTELATQLGAYWLSLNEAPPRV